MFISGTVTIFYGTSIQLNLMELYKKDQETKFEINTTEIQNSGKFKLASIIFLSSDG